MCRLRSRHSSSASGGAMQSHLQSQTRRSPWCHQVGLSDWGCLEGAQNTTVATVPKKKKERGIVKRAREELLAERAAALKAAQPPAKAKGKAKPKAAKAKK